MKIAKNFAMAAATVGLLFTNTSCETRTQDGALIGALGGAAIGAAVSRDSGRGALIGGAIGAAGGAAVGSAQDRNRGPKYRGGGGGYSNRNG